MNKILNEILLIEKTVKTLFSKVDYELEQSYILVRIGNRTFITYQNECPEELIKSLITKQKEWNNEDN